MSLNVWSHVPSRGYDVTSHLPGGGVCSSGLSVPRGVGCLFQGRCLFPGGSLLAEGGMALQPGGQINMCKNITHAVKHS